MSTYTGWDHKWDLLVVESLHVIWVTGDLDAGGGGGVRLKRQGPGNFVGHWKR